MAMLGRAKLKSTIPGVEALKETKDRPGFYRASEIQPSPTDGIDFTLYLIQFWPEQVLFLFYLEGSVWSEDPLAGEKWEVTQKLNS